MSWAWTISGAKAATASSAADRIGMGHPIARGCRTRRLERGEPGHAGIGPDAPAVPGSLPSAGRGTTSSTSWPAAPSPRASASVETVTPERYGRYVSPKIATRSG